MADTYPSDYVLPTTWTDLITIYPQMTGNPSWVQNRSNHNIVVSYSSSGTAPTGGGMLLKTNDIVVANAGHIWAKALGSNSSISMGLSD